MAPWRRDSEALTSLEEMINRLRDSDINRIHQIDNRLAEIERIQQLLNSVGRRLDKLEQDNNSRDQWARMNNIELKGVPQSNNENLFEIFEQISNKVNYPVDKAKINYITRVQSRERGQTKNIIVSFRNRYVKEEYMDAVRLMLRENPLTSGQINLPGDERIYINDHLTLVNKGLLSLTKKRARAMNFRYVWVKACKIHVRKTETSPIIIVKTEKDLAILN